MSRICFTENLPESWFLELLKKGEICSFCIFVLLNILKLQSLVAGSVLSQFSV